MARFIKLLKDSHIDRPKPGVLNRIRSSFAAELFANIDNATSACDFYYKIEALPSTTTRAIINSQLHINVNGPLSLENPKLLTATDDEGRHIVVKLLFVGTDSARSVTARRQDITNEIQCCQDLGLSTQLSHEIALVPCEVVTVFVPLEFASRSRITGEHSALLMPRFITSLVYNTACNVGVVVREGRRMVEALRYIHSRGYVHMDVKADNIFVNLSGAWFLGDFGSACKVNNKIQSSTEVFYYERIIGQPAETKYDWFMLLVTLLRELGDRQQWMKTFVRDNHVDKVLIVEETKRVIDSCDSSLKGLPTLVTEIASLAELELS